MNIVVLMKEVPDTKSPVQVGASGDSIQTEGLDTVINPYDEYAIEEALRIKTDKGGEVVLLTVGPDSCQKTIRKGLAMGADRAVLIDDPAALAADSLGLARVLSKAIEQLGAQLVICGREATDQGRASVGPAVAEMLGWPQVVDVVAREATEDDALVLHAEREGGHAVVKVQLPALITTQKGLNEPRITPIPAIMKAKKKPLEKKSLADLGLDAGALAPRTKVTKLAPPPVKEKSLRWFEGADAAAKAKAAVHALTDELKIV